MNTTPSSPLHVTSTTASERPRSDQDQPQVDARRRAPAAGERALVLGGGGSTGNAWLIGVIAGLFDAGLDVTEADLIIGTSAGSTAAAQITSASPPQLMADILAAAPQPRTGPVGSGGGRVPIGPVADHLDRMSRIIAAAEDAADMRRRMGAAALDMDAASDGSGKRGGARPSPPGCPVSGGRTKQCSSRWSMPIPVNRSCSTATAESTWWTPLPPARAGGPPYGIGDQPVHRRRLPIQVENADLAAGYGRVLVLSPFGGTTRHPRGVGHPSGRTGRRTTRPRQQSRDDLPGQQLRAPVRRQCDGSIAASARRSSRLRPRQSACRAAHRILALTPWHSADPSGVPTPA